MSASLDGCRMKKYQYYTIERAYGYAKLAKS